MMIIDDEKDFSSTLAERLDIRGFETKTADDAENALLLLKSGWPVDVVILDLLMPGIDGLTTLSMIKKQAPLIEVIMLTGHGSASSGIEGMKRGLFDYLIKPVDIDELVTKINEAARQRKRTD